jgi:hypothetical protein
VRVTRVIAEAQANGMEVLAHLSRTTALAGAKDLLESGVHALAETLPASLIDTMRTQLAQAEAKGNPPKPEW